MGFFSKKKKEEPVSEVQIRMAEIREQQRLQQEQVQAHQAELAKAKELKAFSIHDADAENKFLQTKLLEKWDNIFQRKSIIDKLGLFEAVENKKRFIAESFSLELISDTWKVYEIDSLELCYESQGNQLLFNFAKKENSDSEFELSFEYKTNQEADCIKTKITGTTDNSIQNYGIYGFLYSLGYPEIADDMDKFFTKLKEAAQRLPNKNKLDLEKKYSSALNNLSTL